MHKWVRLRTQQGKHLKDSIHKVAEIVPHGGYTDAECQYVLSDGTHVTSDHADEIGIDEALAEHMFEVDSMVS